jgi:alkylresorcinol/alkylpyrone synthase
MPAILAAKGFTPTYRIGQEEVSKAVHKIFEQRTEHLKRYVKVFDTAQIRERYFCMPISWYGQRHSFQEKNNQYIRQAIKLSTEAVQALLNDSRFFTRPVQPDEIDAIIFISSTGLATPTIETRLINTLSFSPYTVRLPLWGLGCAGGAAGLSRAFDYCRAHSKANVLVACIELCSLTFQQDDQSVSNLVGTALFGDGVGCALVAGDQSGLHKVSRLRYLPHIRGTQSVLKPDSQDVMGWDIRNEGFYVIFAKSIPDLVRKWLKEHVDRLLAEHGLTLNDCSHFIAHPGGKKVLEAYSEALGLSKGKLAVSKAVLERYGNMSSATVLFVLEQFMLQSCNLGDYGMVSALGPGFSSELVLVQWQ